MIFGVFVVEFLVKSVRIGSFRGEQLHPQGFFKFITHKEGIVLCLHPLFIVTPIQGVNRCSCSHPQNARLPMSLSSVGMTTSCSATQLRKTSLPICVSRGGSQIQWANVEESRTVISVPMRLTSTRLLQFSQARGPILWKSLAPQNAPSGSARGLLEWSMSKVMVASVRQLSKAYLPSCAPGARTLLSSVS